MDSEKRGRGTYIVGQASDYIVKEFLLKKEYLLQYNPKGAANGAAQRKATADALTTNFNRSFPSLNKNYEQLKEHFCKRRDAVKKALIMERTYMTATGGGVDKKVQSIIDKLKSPTESDALLIQYLKKSDALGVGPLTLQTGYVLGIGAEMGENMIQGGDGMEDENGNEVVRKKARKGPLSVAGMEKASKRAHHEWMKAVAPAMAERAASLGYGKPMGWMNGGSGGEPAAKKKRMNMMETSGSLIDSSSSQDASLTELASSVKSLRTQFDSSKSKADAAIEAVEQLRSLVKYGGEGQNVKKEYLEDILAGYDAKLQSSKGGESKDAPITLF